MNNIWQSSKIVLNLQKLLGYFHIVHYVRQGSSSLFYTILFALFNIIFFQIMSFVFVAYFISLQKTVPNFLIRIVRVIWTFMNTIFLVPIIEIFLTIVVCETDGKTGNFVNHYYSDIECWKGTHIGMAAASILGLVVYFSFNIFYTLLYFDGLCLEIKGKNKKNGRANFFYNANLLIVVILFNFLNSSDYQIFLILYMIFGYFVVFIHLHYNSPYTHNFAKKFFKVVSSLSIWNSFISLICMVVEGILFQGTVYAWFLSIPLITILEFTTTNKELKHILMTSTKFNSPKQVEGHARFVLHLIQEDSTK